MRVIGTKLISGLQHYYKPEDHHGKIFVMEAAPTSPQFGEVISVLHSPVPNPTVPEDGAYPLTLLGTVNGHIVAQFDDPETGDIGVSMYEGFDLAEDARLVGSGPPREMGLRQFSQVNLEMENTGEAIWYASANVALALKSDPCGLWSSTETTIKLPTNWTIMPGESHVFPVSLTSSETAGICPIELQMRQDDIHGNEQWFGEPIKATVYVGLPTPEHVRDYLLGRTTDPTSLDVNHDAGVDAADLLSLQTVQ